MANAICALKACARGGHGVEFGRKESCIVRVEGVEEPIQKQSGLGGLGGLGRLRLWRSEVFRLRFKRKCT